MADILKQHGPNKIEIKKNKTGKWDIYINGVFQEGGFFSKVAAYNAAKEH